MPKRTDRWTLSLALAGALAGCATVHPTAVRTTPTSAPTTQASTAVGPASSIQTRLVPAGSAILALSGTVQALSDSGAGLIANNGGTLISDYGTGIISSNGAGVISSHGAGYKLLSAGSEAPVESAVITIFDAQGRQFVGADGKPLSAKSDKTGAYALSVALPPGNLVLRVSLASGNGLAAMLARGKETTLVQPIDTATSLGAAYVLDTYVQGNQSAFDLLAASQFERLHLELQAGLRLLPASPHYLESDLVQAVASLRTQALPVSQVLDNIHATLLGQAQLGDGRPATEVPLQEPFALAFDAKGNLLVAEYTSGRIRAVAANGTLTTLADPAFGTYKLDLPHVTSLAPGPDGSLYVASRSLCKVFKLAADDQVTTVAGDGTTGAAPLEHAATAGGVVAYGLAVGPDGTVYVGEERSGETAGRPRVLAIGKDGIAHDQPIDPAWGAGTVDALAFGTDGTLRVLFRPDGVSDPVLQLYTYHPGDAQATLLTSILGNNSGRLAVAPDGTTDVALVGTNQVIAVSPTGAQRTLVGDGGQAAPNLTSVGGLTLGPDGTLYVSDESSNVVTALPVGGQSKVVAGHVGPDISDPNALAINSPTAVALDPQGKLVIAESGDSSILRFDGQAISALTGHGSGLSGDGGPATQAQFSAPSAIAYSGADLYVLDLDNNRIRRIDSSGVVTSVAYDTVNETPEMVPLPQPGQPTTARRAKPNGTALAVGPDGRVYWGDARNHLVERLSADGQSVELVAGGGTGGDGPASGTSFLLPSALAFSPSGDLYVADLGAFAIRRIRGLAGTTPTVDTVAGVSLDQLTKLPSAADDGNVKHAPIWGPVSLTFDAAGNLYYGEIGTTNIQRLIGLYPALAFLAGAGLPSTPARVRRLGPDGVITTVAGPGGLFFPDASAPDALGAPAGLVIDKAGRLVVTDTTADLIRILPAGEF